MNGFNYMMHWWAYLVIITEKMHSFFLIICIHKVNCHVFFFLQCLLRWTWDADRTSSWLRCLWRTQFLATAQTIFLTTLQQQFGAAKLFCFHTKAEKNKTHLHKMLKRIFHPKALSFGAQLAIHSSNFWPALVKHFLLVYVHNFLLLTIKLHHPNISNAPSDP